MTALSALAACILSGQVPDERVPSLVAETPGLREELERQSRAMSPVLTGEAGRGDRSPSHGAFRPAAIDADGFLRFTMRFDRMSPADTRHFHRQSPLPHCLGEQEGRRPFKTRGLLSKFISSLHPASFLRKLWRQ